MKIRYATKSDLTKIVDIHLTAFPGFTLSLFGKTFLMLFYAAALEDDCGLLLVAEHDSELFGFVAGTLEPGGYYKKLLKQKNIQFALAAMKGILFNPHKGLHLFKMALSALVYRGDKPKDIGKAALLSSIGVSTICNSKGIGQLLVEKFENEVSTKGSDKVYLTTDANENDKVNLFYQKCGYSVNETILKSGNRLMNVYLKKLS